jgi:hypothetical protein
MAAIAQQDTHAQFAKDPLYQEHPCHIYMIAGAPRILIDAASLKMDDKTCLAAYSCNTKTTSRRTNSWPRAISGLLLRPSRVRSRAPADHPRRIRRVALGHEVGPPCADALYFSAILGRFL